MKTLKTDNIYKNNTNITINELLKGTKANNLVSIIPENIKVLSLYVTDNIAYVSFSKDLIDKNYTEKEEALIIYSIVNTLTSLPDIEEVQILIDGKAENEIGRASCRERV